MLTTYFRRLATCSTYYAGPAGPYLDEFTNWLAKQGFDSDAIRHFVLGATKFANWIHINGGCLTSLPTDVWSMFCAHLNEQGWLYREKGQHTIYWRGARHFVKFLCDQYEICADRTKTERIQPELVTMFENWMQIHRGVKPSTLSIYRRHVIDLLSTLDEPPEQFNATKLYNFILAFAKRNGCAVSQIRVKAIRMFLRFLDVAGLCQPGLDAAIPTIARWRLATLPRYLSTDDVELVLAACNGTRAIDVRDKAILLLLARLGLRACEVAQLKLEDIDWFKGVFTVIGKSRREARLPLPQDVGDAVLNYLEQSRPPVNSNYIFISVVAPWESITSNVVRHAAARAFQRAGVKAASYGPHILRHSAATGLLRQGASLQVISEILRHRSIDTSALYAKVDVGLLQRVIRPWPGARSC